MNLPKSIGLLVFALLAFILKIIVASPPNQRTIRLNKSTNQTSTNKSPYWEYILREFVFKTISSPPQTSNILYKKLLEAPFYGGPLPTASNEDNVLLSRGNVYHLPDGQWILCQDNCNDCIPCSNQKNSIVKWTLRKVKRYIAADSYRYDLQMTVVPQLKDGVLKNIQTGNYVYAPYESIIPSDVTLTTEMTHIDRSRSGRSWRRIQRDDSGQIIGYNDVDANLESTTEYSDIFRSTSSHEHNATNSENFVPTHRLIMGIDQSGKKHVIHVVSMVPSEISSNNNVKNENNDNYTVKRQPNQIIHGPSYQRYVIKLLESIHSHRPIIEAFLSYNRIKIDNSTESFYPVYSEFIDNKNTKFDSNFRTRDENNRPRDWSQILTRMPRDKNYIPKLIKKFNGNFTNIIRSRSISLF